MNRIKRGNVYTAAASKSGSNNVGNWEAITVRDANGKNPITVFVDNTPSGVKENSKFRIEQITDVNFGKRQISDDNWIAVTSIRAVISPVMDIMEFQANNAAAVPEAAMS